VGQLWFDGDGERASATQAESLDGGFLIGGGTGASKIKKGPDVLRATLRHAVS
jgi:hypothetical protein